MRGKYHGQKKPTKKQIENVLNVYDILFNKNFGGKNNEKERKHTARNRGDNRNSH